MRRLSLARDAHKEQIVERDAKDYAIEFGEYLAKAAESYMRVRNDPDATRHDDEGVYEALVSAIYEFRKRAAKVAVTPQRN
jgi:hypothetical protein